MSNPIQELYSDDKYCYAEMGACMLSEICRNSNEKTENNSASYIAGWKKSIKDNPSILFEASRQSQKAVDRILGE